MQELAGCPPQGVISSPCGEDSGDEELSVLPRHTKVVVTGNNRTKSVLVGLHGVVKKAVGLGGWHWLVLTNGIEVKLQRNALSVLEAPTGHEVDDGNECEHFLSSSSEIASEDFQKPHKPKQRSHKTVASVTKALNKNHTIDVKSTYSKQSSHGMLVDLSKLETTALWRYWRHFNLVDAFPNPSKEQLIDIVQQHFMAQEDDCSWGIKDVNLGLPSSDDHWLFEAIVYSLLSTIRQFCIFLCQLFDPMWSKEDVLDGFGVTMLVNL